MECKRRRERERERERETERQRERQRQRETDRSERQREHSAIGLENIVGVQLDSFYLEPGSRNLSLSLPLFLLVSSLLLFCSLLVPRETHTYSTGNLTRQIRHCKRCDQGTAMRIGRSDKGGRSTPSTDATPPASSLCCEGTVKVSRVRPVHILREWFSARISTSEGGHKPGHSHHRADMSKAAQTANASEAQRRNWTWSSRRTCKHWCAGLWSVWLETGYRPIERGAHRFRVEGVLLHGLRSRCVASTVS